VRNLIAQHSGFSKVKGLARWEGTLANLRNEPKNSRVFNKNRPAHGEK
jgi:hypothetical protein